MKIEETNVPLFKAIRGVVYISSIKQVTCLTHTCNIDKYLTFFSFESDAYVRTSLKAPLNRNEWGKEA